VGCINIRKGMGKTLGDARVTKSPTPGTGAIARTIALTVVLLGYIVPRPCERRLVHEDSRGHPMKGLSGRTRARTIMGWGRRLP